MHCHLAVSISSKILFLPYKIFLKKNKTLPIQILQSIIWHQYRLSTINHFHFLFIHSEASIGVLVKRLFEFLDHPSISISKKSFSKNFANLSNETFILESFSQVDLPAFQVWETPLTLKGSYPCQKCKRKYASETLDGYRGVGMHSDGSYDEG